MVRTPLPAMRSSIAAKPGPGGDGIAAFDGGVLGLSGQPLALANASMAAL
jgi:hypothetical protein